MTTSLSRPYAITVDYSKPLQHWTKKGNYDFVDPESIPPDLGEAGKGKSEVEIILVQFAGPISTKKAEKKLLQLGLRSATLIELLALGAAYPDLQKQHAIVALGTVWSAGDGRPSVAFLGRWHAGRGLFRSEQNAEWFGGWRFACVKV